MIPSAQLGPMGKEPATGLSPVDSNPSSGSRARPREAFLSCIDTECIKGHCSQIKKNATKLIFLCSQVKNGHVRSVMDEDISSFSIEVQGSSQ